MKYIDDLALKLADVKGWMHHKVPFVVKAWLETYNVLYSKKPSAALEIGVHHGRFFLFIENIMPNETICYALDLFDEQEKNIDQSGKGSLNIFNNNINKYAKCRDRVVTICSDSFSINDSKLPEKIDIISIDGGHTKEHTAFDLTFANDHLSPGGLVALDDFANVNWLGVMEGAIDFISLPNRRIAPFIAGYGKLFFTTISEVKPVRESIENYLTKYLSENPLRRTSYLKGHIVRGLA